MTKDERQRLLVLVHDLAYNSQEECRDDDGSKCAFCAGECIWDSDPVEYEHEASCPFLKARAVLERAKREEQP